MRSSRRPAESAPRSGARTSGSACVFRFDSRHSDPYSDPFIHYTRSRSMAHGLDRLARRRIAPLGTRRPFGSASRWTIFVEGGMTRVFTVVVGAFLLSLAHPATALSGQIFGGMGTAE